MSASEPTPETPDDFIGPRYRLEKVVTQGGMGVLWRAVESGTGRSVILKRILGHADPDSRRRFLSEARITARLEHPNIVPVHGLGADADGKPFYTMKLVQGSDLDDVLKKLAEGDAETLAAYPLARLLIIFQKVCDAVAFAHSREVIHRDLKPANIMLGPFGEVLVMDWGLAKVLDESEFDAPPQAVPEIEPSAASPAEAVTIRTPSASDVTMPGSPLGTVFYMAPEQATGEVHRHDFRSDIYALGAILYQFLTLRRCVSGGGLPALLARVMQGDLDPLILPPAEGGTGRRGLVRPSLRHLPDQEIPEGLAAVVRRAMAFEPADRYASVLELQAEITAYQNGFAPRAERAGLGKQILLALQRHRREATVAATLLLVLLAFAVASFLRLRRERDTTEEQRRIAVEQRLRAERESDKRQRLLAEAARSDRLAAQEKWAAGDASTALAHLERALRYEPASPLVAEIALPIILSSAIPFSTITFAGHAGAIRSTAFSPDGRRVLTASEDGTARLWDAASGKMLVAFSGHSARVNTAAFSPDGRRVVTASDDHTARVWDAGDGRPLAEFKEHGDALVKAAFSPDGTRVLSTDAHAAFLWDAGTGQRIAQYQSPSSDDEMAAEFCSDGAHVLTVCGSAISLWNPPETKPVFQCTVRNGVVGFSPDGRSILTTAADNSVQLVEAQSGNVLQQFKGHTDTVKDACFSPDGCLVLTASEDHSARLWEADTGRLITRFVGHNSGVARAIFSPDGRRVITLFDDRTASLWDAPSGQLLDEFPGLAEGDVAPAFSPDGRRILTACADFAARSREAVSDGFFTQYRADAGWQLAAQFSPDAKRVLTVSGNGTVQQWDADTGCLRSQCKGLEGVTSSAQFSPAGLRVLSIFEDNSAGLSEGENEKTLVRFKGHTAPIESIVLSGNGLRILTGSDDHTARLWDARTGRQLREFRGHAEAVADAIFSADGQRVLTASADGTARLWDAEDGRLLAEYRGHTGAVRKAVFDPAGTQVLTTSDDGTARVWDAGGGPCRAVLEGHSGIVKCAAFSPDGRRIVTASESAVARLWDAPSGRLLTEFKGHSDNLASAVFSPDGRRVLTASQDGTARLWDPQSGESLAQFRGHTATVHSAVFSPDGRRILTASADGTTRVWSVFAPGQIPPAWFGEFLTALAGGRLGEDGRFVTRPISGASCWSEALLAAAKEEPSDDYRQLLRWRMTAAPARPIAPGNPALQVAAAQSIVDDDEERRGSLLDPGIQWIHSRTTAPSLEHAYQLDPGNPLIHLALAPFEENKVAADFLRHYSLDRLPDDPALQLRAAELLAGQEQRRWALGYAERALWHWQGAASGAPSAPLQKRAQELAERLRRELPVKP